MPRWWNR